MVDIFDEVEEELRAERAQRLLKQYGGLIMGIALVIIGAAAGWQGWQWYQARKDAAAAAEYVSAMRLAEPTTAAGLSAAARSEAIAAFNKLAATAPSGYATLSRLREAALKADAGDLHGAATIWDQVASDSSVDPLLRDLASLLWATHQIDTGDPALLEARLKVLAAADNAWHTLADEQLALLDLRTGKADEAKAMLRRLSQDTTAPDGVRGRASALSGRLGG